MGPKLSTSNNNGAIGPICDTKKTTVEAIIIAYSKPFSWTGDNSLEPACKINELGFKDIFAVLNEARKK